MLIHQLAIGSLLIGATVLVHALCTIAVMRMFRVSEDRGWYRGPLTIRIAIVAAIVLLFTYAALVEAAMWAVAYVYVGVLPQFGVALYFSIVTFTTLGYGDIVIDSHWRLLASTQAANGVIMFGWTTGIVVALLQHFSRGRGDDLLAPISDAGSKND